MSPAILEQQLAECRKENEALRKLMADISRRRVLFVHGMSEKACISFLQEAIKEWQRELRDALARSKP